MSFDDMPYVGVASFFKAPLTTEPTPSAADVAVLGVPWDQGTTNRSGARFGPRALREASTLYAYQHEHETLYDGEARVELLGGVRWADCGDVSLGPMWPAERYHEAVVERLRPALEAGLFPVTLGGDHSITYPVLKALSAARAGRPFQLVQFDTHMDYWDDEAGQLYSHGCPIIRAQEAGWLAGLTQYGIRGMHTREDNIALAQSRGAHIFWCREAKATAVDDLVEHLEPGVETYITFDIDALDPSVAPGTGTPEPGGFSYYEAKDILLALCSRCTVIGMDLVEVAPQYDGPGQTTALHGARLILDTVGAVFRRRAHQDGGVEVAGETRA
jgi:agmatinase